MSEIEAYVCNLGKYVAGNVDGGYLRFPAATEDVQALLKRIGVDGIRFEEVIITEATTEIDGLSQYINQYADIDELNYLASLLDEMDEGDRERFEAAIAYGEYTGSMKDLINLAQNLESFEYLPGVENEKDLGYYLIDELSALEIPEHLVDYFDYEAYGYDTYINEGGKFINGGYVMHYDTQFTEHYNGKEVPEEYRIFDYPAPDKSILATLEKYQKMIAEAPAAVPHEKHRPGAAHEEL